MTSPTIQVGNESFIRNSAYTKLWGIRYVDDGSSHCDIYVDAYSTAGVFSEAVVTLDGSTGNVTFSGDVTVSGALTSTEGAVAYRTVASDVVPTIGRSDAGGTIEMLDSTTGAKAILTGTSGAGAVALGQEVTLFLTVATGNSYTLALSTGTLTFNAALECAKIVRTSLGWNVVSLNGATIV